MKLDEAREKLKAKVPSFAAKVGPVYNLLSWEWTNKKTKKLYIPTEREVEKKLLSLIDDLEPDEEVATGGLAVYFELPTDGESGHLGLSFTFRDEISFEANE